MSDCQNRKCAVAADAHEFAALRWEFRDVCSDSRQGLGSYPVNTRSELPTTHQLSRRCESHQVLALVHEPATLFDMDHPRFLAVWQREERLGCDESLSGRERKD